MPGTAGGSKSSGDRVAVPSQGGAVSLRREDIMAMEAGAELDALVAEKVMGWPRQTYTGAPLAWPHWDFNGHPSVDCVWLNEMRPGGHGYTQRVWEPSCSMSDASAAIDAVLNRFNGTVTWTAGGVHPGSGDVAVIWFSFACGILNFSQEFAAEADTLPLAICRASLLAVEATQ